MSFIERSSPGLKPLLAGSSLLAMKTLSIYFGVFVLALLPADLLAWWEPGHQIIARLAFELLSPAEQQELVALLKDHPRFREDFAPPDSVRSPASMNRWYVGRAGYWPDVARKLPEYNRPTWHYQLAATVQVGEDIKVPPTPGPVPDSATLDTQELHIAQAVELCRRVLGDSERSRGDRAIAICWLAHLAGDAHQPCHAGSLFAEKVFPDGDRGANSIELRPRGNLHAFWDSVLGDDFELADVVQSVDSISKDRTCQKAGLESQKLADGLDPLTWLSESRSASRQYVYTDEIMSPVRAASRGLVPAFEAVELSDNYRKRAVSLSRVQAARAAYRLAAIWSAELNHASGGRAKSLISFEVNNSGQAVAVDAGYFYGVGNRSVTKFDRSTGKAVSSWMEKPDGPLTHLNSGLVHEGRLYCAHSNYPHSPTLSSVEVWDTNTMKHVDSRSFGITEGALTWIDWHDGHWWAGFASYSKHDRTGSRGTAWTEVVQFDSEWRRLQGWMFPKAVIDKLEPMSNSGASWGPDGRLYCTGHDHFEVYAMKLPKSGATLELDVTLPVASFGQGIAWDRSSPDNVNQLWGIVRADSTIVITEIPLTPTSK